MTAQNIHPDDACRACNGTGRARYEDYRQGRTVIVSDQCWTCYGVGTKVIVWLPVTA